MAPHQSRYGLSTVSAKKVLRCAAQQQQQQQQQQLFIRREMRKRTVHAAPLTLSLTTLLLLPIFLVGSEISMGKCRSLGFDPANLACATCDVISDSIPNLPLQMAEECLACCQKEYMIEPAPKTIYKRAVLKFDPRIIQMFGGFQEFLKDEDSQEILTRMEVRQEFDPDLMVRGIPSPPKVMFYSNETEKKTEADEIISLDTGWKKEDIRDMLSEML